MTKEEAIKVLAQVRQWTDYPKEAFTMAIDALSKTSLPSVLDKVAEKYVSTLCERTDEGLHIDTTLESAFKAGAKWSREQMMEGAVEGEVKDFCYLPEVNYSSAKIEFTTIPYLKEGDKVRIIVCKKED